ncbi:ABC-2 family transporter protein [Candidatus Daviesbacteria bacterium]|nr:ABC-2 family transporter protein [Candidatus Daviesbacteria bacterium]
MIDTLAQFLFREVYRFRDLVVRGDLDLILIKPINPLIRVLLGGADILDLFILILIAIILFLFGINNITTNLFHWFLYLLLIANGLIIAAAFHIFVLGFGITTTSIDHLVLFYRDMSSMLRIPVDLYTQPIRLILTFLIPLGLMITLPAKALMNLVSPDFVIVSFLIGSCLFWLSLKYWNFCLKQYTSASS